MLVLVLEILVGEKLDIAAERANGVCVEDLRSHQKSLHNVSKYIFHVPSLQWKQRKKEFSGRGLRSVFKWST